MSAAPDEGTVVSVLRAVLSLLLLSGIIFAIWLITGPLLVTEAHPVHDTTNSQPLVVTEAKATPEALEPPELLPNDVDRRVSMRLYGEVNQLRDEQGRGQLEYQSELAAVARQHSQEMAAEEYVAHTNLSGATPADRVAAADVDGCTHVEENVARSVYGVFVDTTYGADRYAEVPAIAEGLSLQFYNSAPHREAMLRPKWETTGIGTVITDDGRVYTTQLFCADQKPEYTNRSAFLEQHGAS